MRRGGGPGRCGGKGMQRCHSCGGWPPGVHLREEERGISVAAPAEPRHLYSITPTRHQTRPRLHRTRRLKLDRYFS